MNYIEEPKASQNPSIDKLTMELLLNKTHYAKYLSKTDPQKHSEYQEFLGKLSTYREDILTMTETLLCNPKKMYTNEVGQAFDNYVQTLIKYLEIEEMNKESVNDDPDTLFAPTLMNKPAPKFESGKFKAFERIIPRVGELKNEVRVTESTMDFFLKSSRK
jgi:heptaprenylglyceryl phosphate synthase